MVLADNSLVPAAIPALQTRLCASSPSFGGGLMEGKGPEDGWG